MPQAADNDNNLDLALARMICDNARRIAAADLADPSPSPGNAASCNPDLREILPDAALERLSVEFSPEEWQRIASETPESIAARLPDWRDHGRALHLRDAFIAADFVAALEGDDDALDRLRDDEVDGGLGMAWLADQVPVERGRVDEWRDLLSDMDDFRAELWHLEMDCLAERRSDVADAAGDYAEGEAPGGYYR